MSSPQIWASLMIFPTSWYYISKLEGETGGTFKLSNHQEEEVKNVETHTNAVVGDYWISEAMWWDAVFSRFYL